MIVLLALLNDLPILTISTDNVRYSAKPEKWDMRIVIIVATFLGLIGVVVSFFTLYLGLDVFHLDQLSIQSFVYLKLSIAGHLVVLVARTKGHFWSVKPSRKLLVGDHRDPDSGDHSGDVRHPAATIAHRVCDLHLGGDADRVRHHRLPEGGAVQVS